MQQNNQISDRELIDNANSLNDLINNIRCFSVSDLIRLELILRELENRGYEIYDSNELIVIKEEGDEDEGDIEEEEEGE